MGGPKPAMRDGVSAVVGHDTSDRDKVALIYGTGGRLEMSNGVQEARFTRDANSLLIRVELDFLRDGATVTETFTIVRDANSKIARITRS